MFYGVKWGISYLRDGFFQQGPVFASHLERQVSYFLGNFSPKTSNYCLKNRALGFPGNHQIWLVEKSWVEKVGGEFPVQLLRGSTPQQGEPLGAQDAAEPGEPGDAAEPGGAKGGAEAASAGQNEPSAGGEGGEAT